MLIRISVLDLDTWRVRVVHLHTRRQYTWKRCSNIGRGSSIVVAKATAHNFSLIFRGWIWTAQSFTLPIILNWSRDEMFWGVTKIKRQLRATWWNKKFLSEGNFSCRRGWACGRAYHLLRCNRAKSVFRSFNARVWIKPDHQSTWLTASAHGFSFQQDI